jgi:hypothetical protein
LPETPGSWKAAAHEKKSDIFGHFRTFSDIFGHWGHDRVSAEPFTGNEQTEEAEALLADSRLTDAGTTARAGVRATLRRWRKDPAFDARKAEILARVRDETIGRHGSTLVARRELARWPAAKSVSTHRFPGRCRMPLTRWGKVGGKVGGAPPSRSDGRLWPMTNVGLRSAKARHHRGAMGDSGIEPDCVLNAARRH